MDDITFGSVKNNWSKGRQYKKELIRSFGGLCQRCNNEWPPYVMEFHHRNPHTKLYSLNIGDLGKRLWRDILLEAQKCLLLCSNCHKIIHGQLRQDGVLDSSYNWFDEAYLITLQKDAG